MQLLSQLEIQNTNGVAVIELLHGDLSLLPQEHEVDIMVVSAYPGNYEPIPHTLVGALFEGGLNIYEIAADKEVDLSTQLGCWLSRPLKPYLQHRFNTRRIMSFEPRILGNKPEDVVSNVFRCLNNFLIPDIETSETKTQREPLDISDVAMPMLATGNQRASVEVILPAILTAAVFWLSQGLPIKKLKLVVYSTAEAQLSNGIFSRFALQWQQQQSLKTAGESIKNVADTMQPRNWKQKIADRISELMDDKLIDYLLQDLYAVADNEEKEVVKRLIGKLETTTPATTGFVSIPEEYDYFISYAHAHNKEVQEFVNEFSTAKNGLKIFYDRDSIPPGGLWIKKISDAIQNSKQVICILSPSYSNSPVCWDEFQCAKLKEYNTKQSVIKTIALYKDVALPPVMGIYSYIDCMEGDIQKLKDAVMKI
ncbi:MAG TPA: toll/interleukin-1 receptor domain-containing protein [Parafilimonas sp.]|nr:toll/interleukin-1 receptor domain-containing protein [Parafilimonas sp.]